MSFAALAAVSSPAQAGWNTNGNAAAVAAFAQVSAQMAPDGAGGVIVVWEDYRTDGVNADVYAQRFDASGAPLWGGGAGVVVSAAAFGQQAPVICSNGSGGAIIAWQDVRGGSEYDIYAQALDASGTRLWTPADGVLICGAMGSQTLEVITPDAVGGAIIAWRDVRSGFLSDVYAQRVSGGGVPRWTPDGVGICTFGGTQTDIQILGDQRGGAFVAWRDNRNGSLNNDVFALAVDSTGAMRSGWTTNGTIVCNATNDQSEPTLAPDGRYGFIVAWLDGRTPGASKIFAQRMRADASTVWTPNGIEVGAVAVANPAEPIAVTDGLAGAIIGWTDQKPGLTLHAYAQRVDSLGARQWSPSDGITVCTADSAQALHTVVPDLTGGAIFTWTDKRGAGTSDEIRAQSISGNGTLRWNPLGVAIAATNGARMNTTAIPDGYGGAFFGWQDLRSGNYDIYAFRLTSIGTGVETPGVPRAGMNLFPARPNPFNPHTALEFSLETPSDFTLSIFDVRGRLVRTVAAGWRSAGRHSFTWDGRTDQGSECGSGTYFAALRTRLGTRSIPITLVR